MISAATLADCKFAEERACRKPSDRELEHFAGLGKTMSLVDGTVVAAMAKELIERREEADEAEYQKIARMRG